MIYDDYGNPTSWPIGLDFETIDEIFEWGGHDDNVRRRISSHLREHGASPTLEQVEQFVREEYVERPCDGCDGPFEYACESCDPGPGRCNLGDSLVRQFAERFRAEPVRDYGGPVDRRDGSGESRRRPDDDVEAVIYEALGGSYFGVPRRVQAVRGDIREFRDITGADPTLPQVVGLVLEEFTENACEECFEDFLCCADCTPLSVRYLDEPLARKVAELLCAEVGIAVE